jgi:hypothetical protein
VNSNKILIFFIEGREEYGGEDAAKSRYGDGGEDAAKSRYGDGGEDAAKSR